MSDRELMQQALEALNHVNVQDRVQIIIALRERLAQPEQEPAKEIYAVLFAVEQAVRNGCAPWEVEAAFEKYEAKRKEKNT